MSEKRTKEAWIVFQVHGGILEDDFFKVYATPEEAAGEVMRIAREYWAQDRYANPEHPSYDASLKEKVDEWYREMFESIKNGTDYVALDGEAYHEIHLKTIVLEVADQYGVVTTYADMAVGTVRLCDSLEAAIDVAKGVLEDKFNGRYGLPQAVRSLRERLEYSHSEADGNDWAVSILSPDRIS